MKLFSRKLNGRKDIGIGRIIKRYRILLISHWPNTKLSYFALSNCFCEKVEGTAATEIRLPRVGGNQKVYEAHFSAISKIATLPARKVATPPIKQEKVVSKPTPIPVAVESLLHKAFEHGYVCAVEDNYARIVFEKVDEKSIVYPDAFIKLL